LAPVLDLLPALPNISVLEYAVLDTLAYSDVFDYPLKLSELHRYLTASSTLPELIECLKHCKNVEFRGGFYFLKGRGEIVPLRIQREQTSLRAYERALRYGRILGYLPFIRMVTLTGSLAVRNCDETGDYDYMLVARTGRVWLARAFALLLNRAAHLFGETLCPNLIVSENALEWDSRDLYSAREICQMIPIAGNDIYSRLRTVNQWTNDFLPQTKYHGLQNNHEKIPTLQSMMEFFLNGKFGDMLEAWEMKRKIARFSRQKGFGIETKFNADICQGNFDHHGTWTITAYKERLVRLKV
jgi:hypothetical protein